MHGIFRERSSVDALVKAEIIGCYDHVQICCKYLIFLLRSNSGSWMDTKEYGNLSGTFKCTKVFSNENCIQ